MKTLAELQNAVSGNFIQKKESVKFLSRKERQARERKKRDKEITDSIKAVGRGYAFVILKKWGCI